jgi:CRISPR/Cas system CSM-associated protein Csm2 small subunit
MATAKPIRDARQIGDLLARHFQEQGQTQTAVGRHYGITQSWVGRIYAGAFTPRSDVARQMCLDAGISFFEASAETNRRTQEREKLYRLLDSIWTGTDEDAASIAAALKTLCNLRKSQRSPRATATAGEGQS